jgi:hypothetical protein
MCLTLTESYKVTGVVCADSRVSVDWIENGSMGNLEATTTDGSMYTGQYGYGGLDDYRRVQFTRFESVNGELLFVGRWWNTVDGGGGDWAFRLTPSATDS